MVCCNIVPCLLDGLLPSVVQGRSLDYINEKDNRNDDDEKSLAAESE